MTESKFLVPAAIVVAGIMIAGAIYLGGSSAPRANDTQATTKSEITLPPVTNEDHVRGNRNAPIMIVEYSDIECPFCKVFHETMKTVVSTYPSQVAWTYRHFPIPSLHQKAIPEAVATECAAEQGGSAMFWNYLDRVFDATNSNDSLDLARLPEIAGDLGLDVAAFNTCLSSGKFDQKIRTSMEDASKAGARGTPYSVLVLDKSLSNSKVQALRDTLTSRGLSAQTVVVSEDQKRVALGGALPLELVNEIINVILD